MEIFKEPGHRPDLRSEIIANVDIAMRWLDDQPTKAQVDLAEDAFCGLLQSAAQSRASSDNLSHKLSKFVQHCCKSNNPLLNSWAFSASTSTRLFHFYIEWNENTQHRSTRLLLDLVLASFTRNPSEDVAASIKLFALDLVLAVIARQSAESMIKPSMHSLVHFWGKRAVEFGDVGQILRKVKPSLSEVSDLELWRMFVADLFEWMKLPYLRPVAGKLLLYIFQGLQNAAAKLSYPTLTTFNVYTWLDWIKNALKSNPELLDSIKLYVLTPLFQAETAAAVALLNLFIDQTRLNAPGNDLDSSVSLQVAGLEVGRKCGLVEEPSDLAAKQPGLIILDHQVLDDFSAHPSALVRLSALSIVVSSHSTTRPLSEAGLKLLRTHLPAYHADCDSQFRTDFLAYSRDLVHRVKSVVTIASRRLTNFTEGQIQGGIVDEGRPKRQETMWTMQQAQRLSQSHTSFLGWYVTFLQTELIPTSSYQRHITSLKALLPIFRVGKREKGSDGEHDPIITEMVFTDPVWIRLLLDLTMNSFNDVRETAVTVLAQCPRHIANKILDIGLGGTTLRNFVEEFCKRAVKLASETGRADYGDGAGRLQWLLSQWLDGSDRHLELLQHTLKQLERKLARAELDLGHAAIEESIHGDFNSLGYMWLSMAKHDSISIRNDAKMFQIQRLIFQACQHVWFLVRHVLCDDSPEGHIPELMEEIEGLDAKDILSYSFRAIQESSKLMSIIVNSVREDENSAISLSLDLLSDMGTLTFTQLAELRHRGAFSTVSTTFMNCCQAAVKLSNAFPADKLLRQWYEGAVGYIMSQRSTTRRSAGIPSLISGIIAARAQSPSFEEVFTKLVEIARTPPVSEIDGSSSPQVHALNCLRVIFQSSTSSRRAEIHLPTTLQLATESLKSEIWAIRNCGLLLLRSLIDCLFGTSESKFSMETGWDGRSVRISYGNHPSLAATILSMLKTTGDVSDLKAQSAVAEAVFPALDIIRRAGPPEEHREELYMCVETYLGSRLWYVREMAARTLCSFLLQGDCVAAVRQLIRGANHETNRLHGVLLTVTFVLERKLQTDPGSLMNDIQNLKTLLAELFESEIARQGSPEVLAALLKAMNVLEKHGYALDLDTQATIIKFLQQSSHGADGLSSALFRVQFSLHIVYATAKCTDITRLRDHVLQILDFDADASCKMLEAIPGSWHIVQVPGVRVQLCELYIEVFRRTKCPASRASALMNLKILIDQILREGKLGELPTDANLQHLWSGMRHGELNPGLASAMISATGCLMAVRVLQNGTDLKETGRQVKAWGDVVADALDVNHTFDMRFAAAEALVSFSSAVGPKADGDFLPYMSALYDALNDDDSDVRDMAAKAASAICKKSLAAFQAAEALLKWMAAHFGQMEGFRSMVVSRISGNHLDYGSIPVEWTSVNTLLDRAMQAENLLFAIEKQNLYIDEVRECQRWLDVLCALSFDPQGEASRALIGWTTGGVQTLIRLARENDYPLGWTSDQHVFAICSRVLSSASALAMLGDTLLQNLLREFSVVGKSGFHGSLLSIIETTPSDRTNLDSALIG